MKKQVTKITTLALAFFSFAAMAQEKIQPCNTYEAMEQYFSEDPQARLRYEAIQEEFNRYSESKSASRSLSAPPEYTVPIVFHILYQCNTSYISDQTIMQALKEVNEDFARTASDTNLIVQPFKSSYVNSEIKFVLAKKDPQGNCINGIVRHENAKTRWEQGTANSGGISGNAYWEYTWDPTRYLNVYVVSEIVPQGTVTGNGQIVGYTYRPGTWATGNPHDAIVYDSDFISGTSSGIRNSRSLTHEIGHWLNLAHTWGNTNNPGVSCGDDQVTDTPVTRGEFGGCPSSSVAVCTQTNPAMTGLNNVQNIMNYSGCARNFTSGQTNRMRDAVSSSISGRSNLSTLSNLTITGVYDANLCAPVAEFYPTNCSFSVCAGSSLSMRDVSFNGPIDNIVWSADNGATIANPNASITSITFPNAGICNVTFSVSNTYGSDVKTRQITVLDATPGMPSVYMESFENIGVPLNWLVVDGNNDGITWEQTYNAAYDQSSSFMVPGAFSPANSSEVLQMPIMDVLNNQSNILEFAYAYRQASSAHNDVLRIEGSRDCGGTWSLIYALPGAAMQNGSGGVGTDDYSPATNEWKKYTISAHPSWQNFKNSASVIVRFNYVTGNVAYGNNIYIDAVSWYSTVGVNELTKSIRFNLYPNPTSGDAHVNFTLSDPATVKISVVDVMGREVLPAVENTYTAGEQTVVVNPHNNLAKGIYFVNLSLNGAKMSSKLVVE